MTRGDVCVLQSPFGGGDSGCASGFDPKIREMEKKAEFRYLQYLRYLLAVDSAGAFEVPRYILHTLFLNRKIGHMWLMMLAHEAQKAWSGDV